MRIWAELSVLQKTMPSKPQALPSSLKGSSQRRERHIQLRAQARKRGDDGGRHADPDHRVFDDRGAAFRARETRKKPHQVSSTPVTIWHGCLASTGSLRYRCTDRRNLARL